MGEVRGRARHLCVLMMILMLIEQRADQFRRSESFFWAVTAWHRVAQGWHSGVSQVFSKLMTPRPVCIDYSGGDSVTQGHPLPVV
jgi:hypothetical protein